MSRKSTNLKRTSILVVLAFTMSLLMAFPAMAAGVGLTLDGQGNDVRKTFDVGENVNIATDVWCDIWVKQDGQYAWEGVSGPGQDVVLENVEAGAYVVDAIARDIDATARSVFFVDSAVDFTAKYENGEVTVTAEATNITDPYFQFWKATAGQNDWVAFGNPDAEGNEGYYGTDNTQSFTAEEGTYEIAVYAKDLNGRSQWQDAVAASAEFVAEPELLKVESVSAITTTILNLDYTSEETEDTYVEVQALDAEGNVVPDQTFTFADSRGWINSEGKVVADLTAKADDFTTVLVSVDGTDVSEEFTLDVVDANSIVSLDAAAIVDQGDTTLERNVAVSGDIFVITEATTADGTKLATADGDTLDLTTNLADAELESSDPTVFTISEDGVITVVQSGTANVVVEWNGVSYEFPVTVGADARTVGAAVVSDASVSLTTTDDNTKDVTVQVFDQYEDKYMNVAFADITVESSDTGIVTVGQGTDSDATDEVLPCTLTAVAAGSADVTIKAGTETLATIAVTVQEPAANIESYGIRLVDSNKDFNLDIYTGEADDDDVVVEFIGYDANGIVAKVFNDTEVTVNTDDTNISENTYEIYTSDANVATASITRSNITIAAAGEGTATISIKEGNILRASVDVTVVDTTPVLTSLELAEGYTAVELDKESSPITFDSLASMFTAKDQEGRDYDLTTSTQVLYTSDETVFTVSGEDITVTGNVGDTASITVKDGEFIKVFDVVVVDETAPSNQDTVFASSQTVQGGVNVTLDAAPATGVTAWFAPSGTTEFAEGSTMTKLVGDGSTKTIAAPTTEGDYKLFLVDEAGNVSDESTATLTVDSTAPVVSSATAADGGGVANTKEAGDTVTIAFDEATNEPVIDATNIDSVLALDNTHSWLDGAGAIGSATWSDPQTLVITLSDATSTPTVEIGDNITLDDSTITDTAGNTVSGTITITGSW